MNFNKKPIARKSIFLIYTIFVLTIFFMVVGTTFPQTSKAKVTQSQANETQSSKTSTPCAPEHNSRINQIRVYLEKVKSYQDRAVRGRAIIDLSSLLWTCDSDFAQSSFLSLWQTITSEIESAEIKKRNTVTNTKDENKNLTTLLSINRFLQKYLISRLKSLDKNLAKELSKNFTSEERGFADFLSLEEGFDANNLSQQQLNAMRQFLSSNPISLIMPFLFDLRKQNTQISDQLFLELLSILQNNPNLSFNDLMETGTYLYTSRLNLNGDAGEVFYSSLPVRGIGMVIDLTVEKSEVNRNLTVSYLNLVTKLLLNPVSETLEKTRRYVFGRIMLVHIYKNAPQLVTPMLRALQIHSDGVPDNLKEESFYEIFRKMNSPSEADSYEDNLKDIENTIGSDERGDKAIRLSSFLYHKGQYERIEKVAEYISDIDKRNSVLDVTRYTQAVKLVENNKFDEAELILKKITDSSLRAIVGFRLIQNLQTNKNNISNLASQFIYDVINDAKKADNEYVPLLLLALAKIVYKKDEGLGSDLVAVAVKRLNNNENWHNPRWRIEIPIRTIGIYPAGFSMKRIQGLGISESLDFLIKESKTNLEEVILSIKNEKIQSEAFRLLSRHYLMEIKGSSKRIENNAK